MKDIRQKLKNGNIILGSWLQLPCPDIAEILSHVGYDFLGIDMEHTQIDFATVANIIRGMREAVPFVRVAKNDELEIRKSLDLGAKGVIVPLVNNKEDAVKAVAAAKYPPQGVRGYAFCRDNLWGMEYDAYVKSINEQVVVIAMIESREAVENIDDILSVDGIDGIFIGPYDMSGSYGIPGKTEHPFILEAENKVIQSCQKYKKAAGLHIVMPDQVKIKESIQKGFTFIAIGIDAVFLYDCAQNMLHTAKEVAKEEDA